MPNRPNGSGAHHQTGRHGRSGQGIVEYGLILSLSALLCIAVLVFLGGTLADVLDVIGRAIDEAARGS